MRSRLPFIGVALAFTLVALPATIQAQAAAAPQPHYVTVTTFSAPYDAEGQKVWWWIDSVMVPSTKMDPNVVRYSVGGHNYGSSAGDIVMIAEYANWTAINADCAACTAWFEKRQPAEGTPERTAWNEAQAAFFKHYFGHQDEIYAVQPGRSK